MTVAGDRLMAVLFTAVRSAKIVSLIEVRSLLGKGVSEDDPVREIVEYFTLEGVKVAHFDPFKDNR